MTKYNWQEKYDDVLDRTMFSAMRDDIVMMEVTRHGDGSHDIVVSHWDGWYSHEVREIPNITTDEAIKQAEDFVIPHTR